MILSQKERKKEREESEIKTNQMKREILRETGKLRALSEKKMKTRNKKINVFFASLINILKRKQRAQCKEWQCFQK